MAWLKAKTAIVIGASTIVAGTVILTLHAQEQKNREQEQRIRAEEQKVRAQLQQPETSPEQAQQLQSRLKQLRGEQDQLRQKQDALRNQDPNTFARPALHLSPFTGVRFEGDKIFVTYSGTEYELAGIDELTTPNILAFCKGQYRDLWQKRIAEDLPAVLVDMNHPLNTEHTVNLTLVNLSTGESYKVYNAPMTEENRQAIMKTRLAAEPAKP